MNITNILPLLAEITELSLLSPQGQVDIFLNVSGHTNSISLYVNLHCTTEMYLNGTQPEPLLHLVLTRHDKDADQQLRDAIAQIKQHLSDNEVA